MCLRIQYTHPEVKNREGQVMSFGRRWLALPLAPGVTENSDVTCIQYRLIGAKEIRWQLWDMGRTCGDWIY